MKKVVFLLAVGTLSMPGHATAQDETGAYTWENSTELSFVSTGGNASSSTLGLKSTLTATGGRSTFKIEVGGIRGETTFRTRTATGSATNFTVDETTNSQLTAENYFVRGRYDRAFASAFAFSGAGWDRNTFAGIQNRYSLVAGLGTLSANVRETRSTQRIRVGRRQRNRTCWDCEREWKRMVVPLEPGRPSEARQLLRTRR